MAWTRRYEEVEPQRVNKWLGQSGVCSRREAEALIERGLVSIDGETVTDTGRKILPGQTLMLSDGAGPAALSVVLHKPMGVVSAQPEQGQTPAVRLLTKAALVGESPSIPDRDPRLAPLGRLDMDSRGLLLLSEATVQGWRRLNAFRNEWGMPDIPMPAFNNYLDQDLVVEETASVLELVSLVNFASSYYVGTRVLKPLLIQALGAQIAAADPNLHWNRWFSSLPAAGDFGTQKLFVLRKR